MYARYGRDASWWLDAGLVVMVALVPFVLIIVEVVLIAVQATLASSCSYSDSGALCPISA